MSCLSSMTSTLQLGKYTLFALVYLVVCSLLFVAKSHRSAIVDTFFANENKNSSNENEYQIFDSVNNNFYSDFRDETEIKFEELGRGPPVNPEEIQRMIRRINEICEKYNVTQTLRRQHFLYSHKHATLYCWIRKIASTSFTKFFGDLNDRKVARDYYKEIKFLAPSTLEDLQRLVRDKSVFKFLVVRHPFERLVSSFRDRIEDNSRYSAQAWIYTPRIFRLTRPNLFNSNKSTGNALQQTFGAYRRLKLIPTFREFVTWILNKPLENDDEHWNSYHNHCSLCTVNFDYVLRLDNYTLSEVNYIFSKLGLDIHSSILPKLQSTRGGSTDFPRTCSYFATLSQSDVLKLYDRFRIDFQMFGYDYERYLDCANDKLKSLKPTVIK